MDTGYSDPPPPLMGPQYWNTYRMIVCLAGQMNHFFNQNAVVELMGYYFQFPQKNYVLCLITCYSLKRKWMNFRSTLTNIVGNSQTIWEIKRTNSWKQKIISEIKRNNFGNQKIISEIKRTREESKHIIVSVIFLEHRSWNLAKDFPRLGKSGSSVVLQVDSTVDASRKTSVSHFE